MKDQLGSKMDLAKILEPLRKEIETDDTIREKALPLAREAVRKCSQSIKSSHRGDFTEAAKLMSEAHKAIAEVESKLSNSDFMSKSRVLDTAYQELAEAASVHSILETGALIPPTSYSIPSRAFLTGLADTIGELRRAVLDALRVEDIDRAENFLRIMEEILEELHTFDFPNALIPELRRKCDVGRSLIERTRGDLTAATQQDKLIRELRNFENRMKDD
jgi:translin